MRQQDLIDIDQASDLHSFEQGLVRLAGELDFPLISAVLIADPPGQPPLAVGVGNTPREYLEAFNSLADARRDPVLRRLKRFARPVAYDQATYVREQAADLWETQARFGYHTGVAVALRLGEHRHFVMGVDRRDPLPSDDREVTRLMADLQLVAVHAQDAALRLLVQEQPQPDEASRLTQRELEVLKLTMDGLTAASIADRLAISLPTANFHVRNLREKLGANSKHQAVLRALRLGLL